MTKPKPARSKVLGREAVARAVRAAKRRGEKVVFTSGCFDLLHVGHVRGLEEARRLGDRLVVGVNTDASVRRLKGADRPVVGARQRAELLAALSCVDWVLTFGDATPRPVIAALQPDVYAKGGDWPLGVLRAKDLPPGFSGRVKRLREIPGVHTTLLIERIRGKRGAGARRPRKAGRSKE